MRNQKKNCIDYLTEPQKYALIFGDIKKLALHKPARMREEEVPEFLGAFMQEEFMHMTINYSFAYFGLKEQLVSETQRKDAIEVMKNFMDWDLPSHKLRVKTLLMVTEAMFLGVLYHYDQAIEILEEAVKLDEFNQEAWHWLAESYHEDGEFKKAKKCRIRVQELERMYAKGPLPQENIPSKERVAQLETLFREQREIIHTIWQKPIYQGLLSKDEGIIPMLHSILNDIRNCFRKKDHHLPADKIPESVDDVVEGILHWLSILAGLSYYRLQENMGTVELKDDLLDELLFVMGWDKPRDLLTKESSHLHTKKPDSSSVDLSQKETPKMSRKEAPNPTSNIEGMKVIEILYDSTDFGPLCAPVDGYVHEYVRKNIIEPEEHIIPSEKITIEFSYPLSTDVSFEYTQKGGFTRMDLFRCIYEGYKTIYDAEEEAVGDPGAYERLLNRRRSEGPYGIWGHYLCDLIIEYVHYYPEIKSVELRIGS